jgi:hypothetical protein
MLFHQELPKPSVSIGSNGLAAESSALMWLRKDWLKVQEKGVAFLDPKSCSTSRQQKDKY